jgi:hypothetical protein
MDAVALKAGTRGSYKKRGEEKFKLRRYRRAAVSGQGQALMEDISVESLIAGRASESQPSLAQWLDGRR